MSDTLIVSTVPSVVVESSKTLESNNNKPLFRFRNTHPTMKVTPVMYTTTFENLSTITLVSSPTSIAITSSSPPIVSPQSTLTISDRDEESQTGTPADFDDPKPIEEIAITKGTVSSVISPSDEQQYIIDQIGSGHNVVADCVAGSGKTTTVLFLAQQFPDKKVLQITYNKALKMEVRKKADSRGISNLEIHTYHSLCVKYYDHDAYTDEPMRTVCERNAVPICALPDYDIIVLDEAQDMSILYYWMVKKLMRDCSKGQQPLLLILGDRYQAINQFRDADPRFITLSRQIWERSFVTATLSTSYRLTGQMAAFVNDVMLGEKRIKTIKEGPTVKYIIGSPFASYNVSRLAKIITTKLKEGFCPNDIFVLSYSIESKKLPIRKLENKLVELNIPCYYPTSDEVELDDMILAGKVVFSTFHQSKGRERKIVIVYAFDSNHFTYFDDSPSNICPNTLYVATTRAQEELILLRGFGDINNPISPEEKITITPLPFLTIKHESEISNDYTTCIIYDGKKQEIETINIKRSNSPKYTVTSLTKHLKEYPQFLLNNICNSIFTLLSEPICNKTITSKLPYGKGMCEEVSELNGLIFTGLYERKTTGNSKIEHDVASSSEVNRHSLVKKLYGETNMAAPMLVDYTKITIMYYSIVEGLLNKIAQVPRYDWITVEAVAQCHDIMRKYIPNDAVRYEEEIGIDENREEGRSLLFPKYGKLEISGRMDLVTDTDVFELKCVQELTIEHKLQLLIYAWLWNVSDMFATKGSRRFKLLNIRTGELWELDATSPLLKDAIEILLDNKYGKGDEKPDSVFVAECLKC